MGIGNIENMEKVISTETENNDAVTKKVENAMKDEIEAGKEKAFAKDLDSIIEGVQIGKPGDIEGPNYSIDPDFTAKRDAAVKAIEHINSPEYFENLHKEWEDEATQKREAAIAALDEGTREHMDATVESMQSMKDIDQDIESMVADVKEYTDWLKGKLAEAEKGNSQVAQGLIGLELKKEVNGINEQLDTLINQLKSKQEKAGTMLSAKIENTIKEIEAMKM